MNKTILLLATTLLFACDSNDSTDDVDTDDDMVVDEGSLRVAHFSPDAPAVDIFVNAADDAAFSGAAFRDATVYANLPVADYDVQISAAGTPATEAVFTVEGISVAKDASYTAIAHGYLSPAAGDGAFTVSLLENDRTDIEDGTFRVQVVHAAAAGAFAMVDVWNITDLENPTPLIPEFAYAAAVTTDLPAGAYTVCLDVNKDATCDATFELPQLDGGFINLIATNDTAGVPSLVAILETGDTVEIAAK